MAEWDSPKNRYPRIYTIGDRVMKVSVVIPAYNEEKYLGATLESIQQLDRKPDEVIIIDGGSTDNTVEVAKRYGAIPITVPHRGIGFARQKGLEAASGDIVAFTDADTIVPHFWLTKIIESLSRPGVVGVYSEFSVPNGWLPYRLFTNVFQPIYIPILHFLGVSLAPGQNTAFWKQKALEAGGYPTDFKIAEDLEMARRLKKVGKLVYRWDNFVTSSGRRGDEGPPLLRRVFKAYTYYFFTKKADRIGFPDIR